MPDFIDPARIDETTRPVAPWPSGLVRRPPMTRVAARAAGGAIRGALDFAGRLRDENLGDFMQRARRRIAHRGQQVVSIGRAHHHGFQAC